MPGGFWGVCLGLSMSYEKNLKKIIAEYGDASDAVVLNKDLDIPLRELRQMEGLDMIELETLDMSGNHRIKLTSGGWSYFERKKIARADFWKTFFGNFLSGFASGVAATILCQLAINYVSTGTISL